jgi:diadenosine tetraphosphate (Ap4A) HIT family hydrolase
MPRKECIIETQPDLIEDSNAPWDQVLSEDYHVKVFADKYPVTEGHMLFVPKYNTVSVLMDCFEQAVNDGIKG